MHREQRKWLHGITQDTCDHRTRLGYLVLSNKGFHSVNVLRDRILIPLNEGWFPAHWIHARSSSKSSAFATSSDRAASGGAAGAA